MADRNSDHVEDISTDDVRGGVTGQGVRYVLFWSLGGAVVAMVVVAIVLHFMV